MKSCVFFGLLLCGLWVSSESVILLTTGAAAGVTAVSLGAATVSAPAAAALGVGALAVLKGVLVGKQLTRRNERDVNTSKEAEDVAIEVSVAQQMDSAGCVAKLLCEIKLMSAEELTPSMASFKSAFENDETLRASNNLYDLAIGSEEEPRTCGESFAKCVLSRKDLFLMFETVYSC